MIRRFLAENGLKLVKAPAMRHHAKPAPSYPENSDLAREMHSFIMQGLPTVGVLAAFGYRMRGVALS